MKTERKLERGCVVFMTSDSGIKGYGNEQCVKSVSHELGELSLFGHNECCKTYHVREIVSFPDQFTQPAGVAPPVSNEASRTPEVKGYSRDEVERMISNEGIKYCNKNHLGAAAYSKLHSCFVAGAMYGVSLPTPSTDEGMGD